MKKIIILAVDDDPDDIDFFRDAVNDVGEPIECVVCSNGREALQKLETMRQLPDLIFMDVNMPGLTGVDCLRHLRSDERYKDIPVVMHSTSILEDDERLYKSLQAFALLKETDYSAWVKNIEHVLGKFLS
jgi:CheY-like chemotaxis protein